MNIDWHTATDEVVSILQQLLRFDTTNPPGNELPAAQWCAEQLSAAGLSPTVLESAPGRGNVVARLAGTGGKPPILLSSHLDVVPAQPTGWTHPPFAGEVADGYVWGRGTMDMKHMTAQCLWTIITLARQGVRLERDVIFAGFADEEAGGKLGAAWMVEQHPELLRAEIAFNEFGGFTLHQPKGLLVPVMVAEKGVAWVTVTIRGEAGHGAIPRQDTVPFKLAQVIAAYGSTRLGYQLLPAVRAMFEHLAALQGPRGLALKALYNERTAGPLLDHVLPDKALARAFSAMLHNTVSPTTIAAGSSPNVIPDEATLRLDCRFLPGTSRAELLHQLAEALPQQLRREVSLSIDHWGEPYAAENTGPVLAVIEQVIRRHRPTATVSPYLMAAFTDAGHLAKLGATVYGFMPVYLKPDEPYHTLAHNVNERVSVAGLGEGTRWFYETVVELAR